MFLPHSFCIHCVGWVAKRFPCGVQMAFLARRNQVPEKCRKPGSANFHDNICHCPVELITKRINEFLDEHNTSCHKANITKPVVFLSILAHWAPGQPPEYTYTQDELKRIDSGVRAGSLMRADDELGSDNWSRIMLDWAVATEAPYFYGNEMSTFSIAVAALRHGLFKDPNTTVWY